MQAAPPQLPARAEPPAPDFAGSAAYRNLDQLLPAAEAPPLDRCVEELQQRLNLTSESLGRAVVELQKEKTLSEHSKQELAVLRQHLNNLAHELEALRHTNARLQQELRSKKDILDGAVLEHQSSKEKILLYIKRLRDEVATLQLKLSSTETDVLRLRHEKDAIAAEYTVLTNEYERIYANFRK
jgi:chromosome segregation ATPase